MANTTTGQVLIDPNPQVPRRLLLDQFSAGFADGVFLGYITLGLLVAQHTSTGVTSAFQQAGITPTFQQASGAGDRYANTGRETLWIHNNGPTAMTVTIKAQSKCNVGAGFLHDIVTVVAAAGGEASMGPAAFQFYNDTSGYVQIRYDTVVGVTVALTAP